MTTCRTCTPISTSTRNCARKAPASGRQFRDGLASRPRWAALLFSRFRWRSASADFAGSMGLFNIPVENSVQKLESTQLSGVVRIGLTACTESDAGTFVVQLLRHLAEIARA